MAFAPFNNGWAQLVAALGSKNSKLVGKLDKIERILPSAGTVHELRNRNSYGLVSAVDFKGRVEMAYDRIELNKFHGPASKQDNFIRTRKRPTSTHKALGLFNRKWGMGIPPEHVEDLPIVWDAQNIGTVILRAKEGDWMVTGETQFKLRPGPDSISDLGLNGDLGMALYPSGQNTKGQAHVLSYQIDTTPHNAYLASMWEGQPIDEEVVTMLSDLTGKSWITTAGDFSLQGASVTYAGVVRPGNDLPKPNFTRIVTIKLGTACANFAGELVLYHNPN